MASVTKSRCKALWLLMQRTSEAATMLSQADPQSLNPADMRKHLLKFSKLHLAIVEANSKLSAVDVSFDDIELDHDFFITVFTRLISSISPLLATLDLVADFGSSSVQVDVFWKLWDLFVCCCEAHNIWPDSWPQVTHTRNTPLHSALHAFLTWMLPFTRKPNGAWASLLKRNSKAYRAEQAWCILTVPLNGLVSIASQPSNDNADTLDFIYNLPPDHVVIVCCLVCEQLGDLLPNVVVAAARVAQNASSAATATATAAAGAAAAAEPLPASSDSSTAVAAAAAAVDPTPSSSLTSPHSADMLFTRLARCVVYFVNLDIDDGRKTLLQLYCVPSVMQLLKSVVAHYPAKFLTKDDQSDASSAIRLLTTMIKHASKLEDDFLEDLIQSGLQSANSSTRNRNARRRILNAAGSSASLTGSSIARSITTDIEVLRAMSRLLLINADYVHCGFRLLEAIHSSWDMDRSCSLPGLGMTHQVGCMNVTAQACLVYSEAYMQVQKERAGPQALLVDGQPPRLCIYSMDMRMTEQEEFSAALSEEMLLPEAWEWPALGLAGEMMLQIMDQAIYVLRLRETCVKETKADASSPWQLPHLREQMQQRLQHQQAIIANPDIVTLQAWTYQPGTIVALEALMRVSHATLSVPQSCTFMQSVLDFLVAAAASPDPNMLPSCLSLAATVQKVLHGATHSSKPHSAHAARTARRQARGGREAQKLSVESMDAVMDSLLRGLSTLDRRTQLYDQGSPGLQNYRNSSQDDVSGDKHSRADDSAAGLRRLGEEIGRISSEGDQINLQGVVMYPFASRRALLVYQLQAVFMACLIPVCHTRVQCGEDDPFPWLTQASYEVGKLKSRLGALGSMLMSEEVFSSRAKERCLPASLERFSVVVFGGRVVPGCGHLGCENLEGTSEAGMRTWLCGGCKRSRYCSRECQKNAWELGHSSVCGTFRHIVGPLVL